MNEVGECREGVGVGEGGSLEEALRAMREWLRAVIYDGEGRVIASTVAVSEDEIRELLTAFDAHDATISKGLDFGGEHFDVHRFYSHLIYGRRGEAEIQTGEGIAICKTTVADKTIYALITYTFPTVSARAVSLLVDFCKKMWNLCALNNSLETTTQLCTLCNKLPFQ